MLFFKIKDNELLKFIEKKLKQTQNLKLGQNKTHVEGTPKIHLLMIFDLLC